MWCEVSSLLYHAAFVLGAVARTMLNHNSNHHGGTALWALGDGVSSYTTVQGISCHHVPSDDGSSHMTPPTTLTHSPIHHTQVHYSVVHFVVMCITFLLSSNTD